MQPIFSSSGEINSQSNAVKQIAATPQLEESSIKNDNKSTETVHDTKKTQQRAMDDKKTDKQLKKNIAQEKLEAPAKKSEASSKTASIEAKKNYDSQDMTASEIATQKLDVLESVKSVKPDGTETYYFPVPVEVLTTLPAPGNLGISAKMMEDMMKASQEEAQAAPAEKIEVQGKDQGIAVSEDSNKIYLEEVLETNIADQAAQESKGSLNEQSGAPPMNYGL